MSEDGQPGGWVCGRRGSVVAAGRREPARSSELGGFECRVPYGRTELPLSVTRGQLAGVITPSLSDTAPTSLDDELALVREALSQPIGAPKLGELARAATSAAIVVSDVTRPCPTSRFLPLILAEVACIPADRVSILFALGSHRAHTEDEQRALVGDEVFERHRCLDLDEDDCVPVGVTSHGTPLEVFRPYVEADLEICTGNLEYHYFAGYSGGAKAVMPGICARSAIRPNHSMMLAPAARAGVLRGNPVRDDIDEAGDLVGIDFIVNVLLDEKQAIVGAVAGHHRKAHEAGVRRYDELFDLHVPSAVDVVVASPGGAPKDINLYQAQKTLDNVAGAVRDGGVIILVARCREGFGQRTFEEWVLNMATPQVLVDRIQREFVLGGHKAAAIAGLLARVDIFLVSEFPDDVVRSMCMEPFATVVGAVQAALARRGEGARCLVVPHGNRVTAQRLA